MGAAREVVAGRSPARARRSPWLFLVLAIGLLLLAAVAVAAIFEFRYVGRIYPGVYLEGVSLSGMTRPEAARAVRDRLTPYPGAPITLTYAERSWTLMPADLGVAVDGQASASAAFAVGRQGLFSASGLSAAALWSDLVAQWSAWRTGVRIEPVLQYDQDRLTRTLQDIAQEVDRPPSEGSLTISGLQVRGTPGYTGQVLDVVAARRALEDLVRAGRGGVLELPIVELQPAVLQVAGAVNRARSLLGKSLLLVADDPDGQLRFAADAVTVGSWLIFAAAPDAQGVLQLDVAADREQATAFVGKIADRLERPVYDALLDFDPEAGRVVVLRPSQTGRQLDTAAAVDTIVQTLLADPAAGSPAGAALAIEAGWQITLPLVVIAPQVDSNRVAELGIVEQVSEGTTYFAGSSAERVQNIANTVGKFKGVVIPPGAAFSFYEVVGDVTLANGFVDSLVIVGDRTEVGVGGGVCQVSTTVYRAAFWGGFPFLERYPHGYVVGWYGDPGWDASIFTPDADFRFLNDSGHHILVKPEIDLKRGRLTFRIYGTKDRTVEADKGVITNRRPAPAPLYREDAGLPAGRIEPVDWAQEGMDVTVTRTIRYDDGRVKQEKIVSKYRPWQAVYLYGPGTELPPEAGVTPTPAPP